MPGPEQKRWRLTWAGRTWTEDDLTGAHVEVLAAALGNDWAQLTPLRGPVHLLAFLAAFSGDVEGVREAKAADVLAALTIE